MKNKKKSDFPNSKTLAKVRSKLSDLNYSGGNLDLSDDASEVEKAKYELCQILARYQREHHLMQKDIAEKLGIDEARVSDILRGKLEGFTLDRLVGYIKKIHPRLQIKIIAA
jgi:predicted XRE-type DNA-binding protein